MAEAEPLPPPPAAPPEEPRPTPAPPPPARRPVFSCSDRGVLVRYAAIGQAARPDGRPMLEGLPGTGTIFWGTKSRGISNHVKKEFKDVGMFIDLAGQIKKAGKAVGEVDEEVLGLRIERAGKYLIVSQPRPENAEGVDEEEDEEEDDDDDEEEEVGAESPEAPRLEENLNHRLESRPERVARLETEISGSLAAVRAGQPPMMAAALHHVGHLLAREVVLRANLLVQARTGLLCALQQHLRHDRTGANVLRGLQGPSRPAC